MTNVPLESDAIEEDKATQVPPTDGDNVAVFPIQIVSLDILTVGGGLTINEVVVLVQPVVVKVNVKVVLPCAIGVITPLEELIVATEVLFETHVPPVGVDEAVLRTPTHDKEADKETVGSALTVKTLVGFEAQPVDTAVNVKAAVPAVIPVIKPELLTVATVEFDDVQVPPVEGDN